MQYEQKHRLPLHNIRLLTHTIPLYTGIPLKYTSSLSALSSLSVAPMYRGNKPTSPMQAWSSGWKVKNVKTEETEILYLIQKI